MKIKKKKKKKHVEENEHVIHELFIHTDDILCVCVPARIPVTTHVGFISISVDTLCLNAHLISGDHTTRTWFSSEKYTPNPVKYA